MRKIQIKFKKIFNWVSQQNSVRVIVEHQSQKVIFDDVLSGDVMKNVLKLDQSIPTILMHNSSESIQVHFQHIDSVGIGSFELTINREALKSQQLYIPIIQTNYIAQIKVRDETQQTKKQLAKDYLNIVCKNQQLRAKRMTQIEKTNNFIKKRQVFLKEYTSKQQLALNKKKSLGRFIKELSSIKRQLKSIDGASEEDQFEDEEKKSGFSKKKLGQYSSEIEMRESRDDSDAHSHN